MSPRYGLLVSLIALSGCSLDVPPAEPTFDQGRPTLTLYQLQDPEAEGHPDPDTQVRVTNLVVTAVDRFDEDGSGRTGTVFVQEIDGGPYSGIQMFRPAIQPASEYLLPGDVVEVGGTYVEFEYGQINPDGADPLGRTVSQITDGIARKTGEWISPEPQRLERPEDAQVDPEAEKWEGVLVEVEDVEATSGRDGRGAFLVTGGAEIDDDNYGFAGVVAGTTFSRIAGVVTYFYTYKLLPRSSLDVEMDAPAQD